MALQLDPMLQTNISSSDKTTQIVSDLASIYYNKQETISDVQVNFDFRRFYSAEGYEITVKSSDGTYSCTDNCLVQTPSNPLREFFDYRKIHCPNSMGIQRGYYVEFEGSIWLIDSNIVDVDGAYQSARMNRCNYKIKWQNKLGDIIERYCYSQDSSSYSSGITGNSNITLGSDQIMLRMPFDSETKQVEREHKFYIDYYNDDPVCYEVTRHDRTSYMDNDNVGLCSWILSERAHTNTELDLEYGIPNFDYDLYINRNSEKTITTTSFIYGYLKYNTTPIIAGGSYKTFTFIECDIDGNVIDVTDPLYKTNYTWLYSIDEDYDNLIEASVSDNVAKIKINYDDLVVGQTLTVKILDGYNNVVCSKNIEIGG